MNHKPLRDPEVERWRRQQRVKLLRKRTNSQLSTLNSQLSQKHKVQAMLFDFSVVAIVFAGVWFAWSRSLLGQDNNFI